METASRPHALAPGTRVRDYTIVSVIGTGGFSIVYKALDNALMREVALKEYFPTMFAARADDLSIMPFENDVEVFRKGIDSFLNEAKLLAQFDHPALVRVYRYWEENKTAYLAMQLYEGDTLRAAVKSKRFVPDEANMRALFSPICDTLELLHNSKCFHRDVAPDNILLSENKLPVLLDFGAARRAIEGTQMFTAILKPGFAPIEQYGESDLKQGPWTDIYALAGVMHYALAGSAPPTAINRVLKDGMPKPRVTFEGRMPEAWLDAVEKGLAVRPENRPQSIAEFRALLGWDRPVVMPTIIEPAAATNRKVEEDPDATVVSFRPPKPRVAEAKAVEPQLAEPKPVSSPRAVVAPPEMVPKEVRVEQLTPVVEEDAEVTVISEYALTALEGASKLIEESQTVRTLGDQRVPPMVVAETKTSSPLTRWLPKVAVLAGIGLLAIGVYWQLGVSPKNSGPIDEKKPITSVEKLPPSPKENEAIQKKSSGISAPPSTRPTAESVRIQSENPSLVKEASSIPPPTPPVVGPSKAKEASKAVVSRRRNEPEIDENGEPIVKTKRTRPTRCTALIEAFQLGNPMSDADQNFFQENCK